MVPCGTGPIPWALMPNQEEAICQTQEWMQSEQTS